MAWRDKLQFWGKKKEKIEKKKEGERREIQKKETPEVKILKAKSISGFAYRILLRPLITEKSAQLTGEGKYVFEVAPRVNKTEIKKAIFDLYGEKPLAVNVIKIEGKESGYGRIRGKRKNWKKAIITFKPGVKLEIFEGV